MKKPPLPDIFYLVCNRHNKDHEAFRKPFIHGDHVISTDMAMIVIADKRKYDTSGLRDMTDLISERFHKLINKIVSEECNTPWEEIEILDKDVEHFMNNKVLTNECYECEGTGTVCLSSPFNHYESECLSCDGTGDHPTIPFQEPLYINSVGINPCYIFLINNADAYQIVEKQLFFRIGDVMGSVMGMRC